MRLAPVAGSRVTALAMNRLYPMIRTKQAAQSVTSSTTLVDDDTLWVPLEADATYLVTLTLAVTGATAGDVKTAWTIPSGATGQRACLGLAGASTSATASDASNRSTTWTASVPYGVTTTASTVMEDGTITTAAAAGVLRLQWAQNASSGTATIVEAGSYLQVERLA